MPEKWVGSFPSSLFLKLLILGTFSYMSSVATAFSDPAPALRLVCPSPNLPRLRLKPASSLDILLAFAHHSERTENWKTFDCYSVLTRAGLTVTCHTLQDIHQVRNAMLPPPLSPLELAITNQERFSKLDGWDPGTCKPIRLDQLRTVYQALRDEYGGLLDLQATGQSALFADWLARRTSQLRAQFDRLTVVHLLNRVESHHNPDTHRVLDPQDALTTYLSDARRVPLLSTGEEKILGHEMHRQLRLIAGELSHTHIGAYLFISHFADVHQRGRSSRSADVIIGIGSRLDQDFIKLCRFCSRAQTRIASKELSARGLAAFKAFLGRFTFKPDFLVSIREEAKAQLRLLSVGNDDSRLFFAGPLEDFFSSQSPDYIAGRLRTAEYHERLRCQARDALVQANLRFVVSVVKRFRTRAAPLLDRIQVGNFGLFKAADLFDPERNLKFSTYAAGWIRQRVARAYGPLQHACAVVTVPIDMQEDLLRTGPQDHREQINPRSQSTVFSDKKPNKLRPTPPLSHVALPPVSIDGVATSKNRHQPARVLEDRSHTSSPQVLLDAEFLRIYLDNAIKMLPEDYSRVLQMRFGLPPYQQEYTRKEVAHIRGTTPEAVRQLEGRALARLNALVRQTLVKQNCDETFLL